MAIHIFHKLVISAHLFMKMTSWGYCVLVYNCSGESFVRPDISGTFRIDSVVIRVLSCCSHFGGGSPERGFLEKDLSRMLLRVRFSLIYIVDLFWGSGLLSSFLQVMPNLLLEFPEEMMYRLEWRLMVRRLVSLVAGFNLTSLKLSTVVVEVGS